MTETSPPELQEKDFIQDDVNKPSWPFWLWGILFTLFVCLAWGIGSWYNGFINQQVEMSPFLQVTNRDFSVFLWQFPEHMRVNVTKGRAGYLPAFKYTDKLSLEPEMAEEYVVAPPELLFLYHTWKRLISNEFIQNPISLSEFKEFLLYAEEWQPANWPDAPKDYIKFANALLEQKAIDPSGLPEINPPKEVVQSFQGWKNFFVEGDAINKIRPTYAEMASFLNRSPHYARNYWKNILQAQFPNYLKTIYSGKYTPSVVVPDNEMAPFLKVAFYNYQKSLIK
jgi:hypothetical protein